MSELLLELFSEEIPSRMQLRAAEELQSSLSQKLTAKGIKFSLIKPYITPRRLTVHVEGLPTELNAQVTEKKGPRVGGDEAALNGFLKSVSLCKEQLEIKTINNQQFYFATIVEEKISIEQALANILNEVIAKFTWPKSMRWGNSKVRWVRPLKSILAIFNHKILEVSFGGVIASNKTYGHRFLSPKEIVVTSFAEYQQELLKNYVVLDHKERLDFIEQQAIKMLTEQKLMLAHDKALLEEIAGLIEWPVVLMGRIDEEFMQLPKEVLTTSMRNHQKYLAVEKADGKLAPNFVFVANSFAADDNKQIIAGNQKVLSARLSDAKFFFEQDQLVPLAERVRDLEKVIFHAKLGTLYQRVTRIGKLAELLPGSDLKARVALLAKADLTTHMVGEFPELQGVMGYYYALHQGEEREVAEAIRDHYLPLGPSDHCPQGDIAAAIAIAEKIDTIVGLFLINEQPTGSKDPFAQRRAALGVIRIIYENKINIDLQKLFTASMNLYAEQNIVREGAVMEELVEFFTDRIKYWFKNQNIRTDVINAVLMLKQEYNIYLIVEKIHSLASFLASEIGGELLLAYKRASNIVLQEEKKDHLSYNAAPEEGLLKLDAEKKLFQALRATKPVIVAKVAASGYQEAMLALENLRTPINSFFESVMVNAEQPMLRKNRLLLLNEIRNLLGNVADFSKLE
jgi:glycyl-tRNA synthetase beta chain